jgi:hypothetical protein
MQTPRLALGDMTSGAKQVVNTIGDGNEFDEQGSQRIQDDGQHDPRK